MNEMMQEEVVLTKQKQWTKLEAKEHLEELFDRALSGEPQFVGEGAEAVVIVKAKNFSAQQPSVRKKMSLRDFLLTMPKGEVDISATQLKINEVKFQ